MSSSAISILSDSVGRKALKKYLAAGSGGWSMITLSTGKSYIIRPCREVYVQH